MPSAPRARLLAAAARIMAGVALATLWNCLLPSL